MSWPHCSRNTTPPAPVTVMGALIAMSPAELNVSWFPPWSVIGALTAFFRESGCVDTKAVRQRQRRVDREVRSVVVDAVDVLRPKPVDDGSDCAVASNGRCEIGLDGAVLGRARNFRDRIGVEREAIDGSGCVVSKRGTCRAGAINQNLTPVWRSRPRFEETTKPVGARRGRTECAAIDYKRQCSGIQGLRHAKAVAVGDAGNRLRRGIRILPEEIREEIRTDTPNPRTEPGRPSKELYRRQTCNIGRLIVLIQADSGREAAGFRIPIAVRDGFTTVVAAKETANIFDPAYGAYGIGIRDDGAVVPDQTAGVAVARDRAKRVGVSTSPESISPTRPPAEFPVPVMAPVA